MNQPLEYSKFPELFDILHANKQNNRRNKLLTEILKKNDSQSIADFACRTGSLIFHLYNNGFYELQGIDASPELIKIAKHKSNMDLIDVEFSQGDMCSAKFGDFDAVITVYNAVGYLAKLQFQHALRNIARNLNDQGLYFFDIFNARAINARAVQDLFLSVTAKLLDNTVSISQAVTYHSQDNLLTLHEQYFMQKQSNNPESFLNQFNLQIYDMQEIEQILQVAGFNIKEIMDFDGKAFDAQKTVSMLVVAEKSS